jgi:hypothetical protein
MKISAIVKGGICLLGLVGVGNLFAAPANAGDAAARGAVTIVRPSGSSISVSGEITAPTGTQFIGPLTITPATDTQGTNTESVTSLIVNPAAAIASTSVASSKGTIESAIATLITGFTNVQDVTALVRAASSGGLE